MIKNVIFDIGNVLVHFRFREYMQELNMTDEQIEALAAHMIFNPIWSDLDRGARSFSDVLDEVKALHPEEADLYDRFWADPSRLCLSYPDTRDWLLGLKKRGYRIYLLSNYPEDMFLCHWRNSFSFTDLPDGKVISYEVKLTKPEPEIYQTLFDLYHLNPTECVYLDDRLENVEAGRAFGMQGIWVNGGQEQAMEDLEQVLREDKHA